MFNLSTGQFLTGDSLATLCFVRKTCSAASILFWSAPALTRLKIVIVIASKVVVKGIQFCGTSLLRVGSGSGFLYSRNRIRLRLQ